MKIYSVFDRACTLDCTYTYRRLGTKTVLQPTLVPEDTPAELYTTATGNLFRRREVAFEREPLLGCGVDLVFAFPKPLFVERVSFADTCTGLGKLEALTRSESGLTVLAAGEQSLAVNAVCENLTVRIHSVDQRLRLTAMDLLAADPENAVFPTPVFAEASEGTLDLAGAGLAAETEDERFAAEVLAKELQTKAALRPTVGSSGIIRLRTVPKITLPDCRTFSGQECFSVSVTPHGAVICGTDRKALIYAVHALTQLLCGTVLPCIYLADRPAMALRGMHLGLPTHDNIPFCRSFISDYMVPLRYNTLFVEVSAAIRLDSHPEIAESWAEECEKYRAGKRPMPQHYDMRGNGEILTKQEVRALIDYAESFGIEVIPEIQSFGHVQYLTVPHPEIAEIDTVGSKLEVEGGAEEMKKQSEPFCYCPQNEDSYRLLFDIADELLDLFRPKRFVSMGHDEIYQIGLCPRCRGKSPVDLYVSDVCRLHAYLAKKGLRMAIWADMLQDCTKYPTFPAVDRIPKDILLLDFIWYFRLADDTEDRLLSRGFEVMLGNLYSSHYPRFSSRAAKKGVVGGQLSTWCEISLPCHTRTGKMFDTAYTAQMMWSADYREDLRDFYTYLIRTRVYPDAKARMYRTPGIGETFAAPAQGAQFALCGAERNRALDLDCTMVSGTDADDLLPDRRVVARPGVRVKKLSFTHATFGKGLMLNDVLWSTPIGKYVIRYEDGSEAEVPLRYGEQIYCTEKFAAPLRSVYYRHVGYRDQFLCEPVVGKTPEGADYTLYTLTWVNPHPEKVLFDVTLCAETDRAARLALFALRAE